MVAIFLSSMAVAFSGTVMPGPLLTYTIRQALNNGPRSGFIIIIGHALLEMLFIVLIFLGFDMILQSAAAQAAIGTVGGCLLVYMGIDMIVKALNKKIKIELDDKKDNSKSMVLAGFVISAANPYCVLWWAVIGLGFLLQAYKSWGVAGVVLFYAGHILIDFFWYGLISTVIGKSRRFINEKLYAAIIIVLGGVLIYFGCSFICKAVAGTGIALSSLYADLRL